MMLHDSIYYQATHLHIDSVPLHHIAAQVGTPAYVYSLPRALGNLRRLQADFAGLHPHIHYSAKANANLDVLRTLINAGAGVDCVSAGEINRALAAGAEPQNIVFAGVGKTPEEIGYAVAQGIGWFNVENLAEFDFIQAVAEAHKRRVRVAPRLNPDITADTDPHIATGHSGAKFGLLPEVVQNVLNHQADYPALDFAGIHVHIGSQLHDPSATVAAVRKALHLITPYPGIRTVNIGGGFPVAYTRQDPPADWPRFADALTPLLQGYEVIMEPGRAIIADAGVLLTRVLYIKEQGGQRFVIVDASMAELLRPALYGAQHSIIPLKPLHANLTPAQVVGAVCETTDTLGVDVPLPPLVPGDVLAVLTTGAYGAVMASNYNARPRPPEVVVHPDGGTWKIARRRETWADLLQWEREH